VKRWTVIFLGLILVSFFSACETKTGCQELHPVTAEQIDGTIQDGKTSKATILSLFGHDFDLSLDSKNRERWIYSLDVVNHMSRNFIPYNFFFSRLPDQS